MPRGRDLSEHIRFLRDAISQLKQLNWNFNVCTDGPWYAAWGPCRLRWFNRQTSGCPRGVFVKRGEIYILFEPTVVDGVHTDDADDGPTPLWKIEKMRSVFRHTPALMLCQVKGESWAEAWSLTVEQWTNRGREIPDFSEFLEEN